MTEPSTTHPEADLAPYVHGELSGAERERIERHLAGCPACRASAEEFRAVLDHLRTSAPEPPPVDWRHYRAELRRKLARRSSQRWRRPALPRLAPALAAAALAAAVALFGWRHEGGSTRVAADLPPFEQAAIGRDLDLLQRYSMVENLDLLEDLDVIENLDRLTPVEQG